MAIAVPVVYFDGGPAGTGNSIPIHHIVIVMMENHPYDNLYGTYCQATGPNCPQTTNGIPPETCVPQDPNNLSSACIVPFSYSASELVTKDPPHEWNATTNSIHGGAMNGFYLAEKAGTLPFGHYNGSTIPVYWDLAQEYGIGDGFYSSALSYSLPNHWYLLAGQAPPPSVNVSVLLQGNAERHAYLNASNGTKTVQDLLNNSPLTSWKYYDWALPGYHAAINAQVGAVGAYNYWNPLAARAESYTSWYVSHFAPRSSFFNDTANGALPDVSWVVPDPSFSDHPPANLTQGESFVAGIVNSVEASPQWGSTAIFLAWDDYGGFYDHVAPPSIDPLGLSLRVPLVVISPYTPQGLVVHSLGYFESLLRFVEWRFNLGCLTPRDCNAPLPLQYFDFSMSPRAPMFFPTSPLFATYPYSGPAGASLASLATNPAYAIDPSAWDTGPPAANLTADNID